MKLSTKILKNVRGKLSGLLTVKMFGRKETDIYQASQWQMIWMNFRKHKLALISMWMIFIIYFIGIFCEVLSPYDPKNFNSERLRMPPQLLRFIAKDGIHLRPFVYGYKKARDPYTLKELYTVDKDQIFPIRFFVKGDNYKFWGLFKTDIHFFNVNTENKEYIHLLGTDDMGRDILSRIIYGTRISTSIGFFGVLLSFIFGVIIGGCSGYFGGLIDSVIQRVIEVIRCIPQIPLWMGLSAAIPANLPPLWVYFSLTIILSFISWTDLARGVRSKFLSLREEDFVMAAKLSGASEMRIIMKHMVPSFFSHIIAMLTLAIPAMIIAETSLSFLGIGLRPPVISWGVLLKEAQNIRSVAISPWMLFPGVAVVVTVLVFNFLGDGLRDAADPYGYRGKR
jgi:peptide/nickel transport system permease protein